MQQYKDLHIGKGLHLGADFTVQVRPFKRGSVQKISCSMLKLSEDGPLKNTYAKEMQIVARLLICDDASAKGCIVRDPLVKGFQKSGIEQTSYGL